LLVVEARQERPEFNRDAGSGFILEGTFPKHSLEKQGVPDEPAPGVLRRRKRVLSSAFQHELPVLGEAKIENVCGRAYRSLLIGPAELNRTKFHLKLAHIGYGCIG